MASSDFVMMNPSRTNEKLVYSRPISFHQLWLPLIQLQSSLHWCLVFLLLSECTSTKTRNQVKFAVCWPTFETPRQLSRNYTLNLQARPTKLSRKANFLSLLSLGTNMAWKSASMARYQVDLHCFCHGTSTPTAQLLENSLHVSPRLAAPYEKWCVIDDGDHELWYNTENRERFEVTFERPVPETVQVPRPQAVIPGPEHREVMSWFVVEDENDNLSDEYIEPLISHLRFPLHNCLHPAPVTPQYQHFYANFKGWILPPPSTSCRGDTISQVVLWCWCISIGWPLWHFPGLF